MVELDTVFFPEDSEFLLLDIGPGAGGLAEHYGQHRRVVTVERDEQLAREVAKRSTPWQLSSCRGTGDALPLRSASVDGVIALEVLEHVEDPDAILADAWRVLKPNGALCIAVPTGYTEAVYSRLHPRYMSNATHVRIFKKKDLLGRIEEQGFSVARVSAEHFEPAVAWFFYSILRAEADHTGIVLDHPGVAPRVTRVVSRLDRTRGLSRVVARARRHFGKSRYVYAIKQDG
jgi:2-polyprenyl-3-methyl-5-hydroxy-6-metoxy-1,4-benzoquinol methylase